MARELTTVEADDLVRRYTEGESTVALCQEFGIHPPKLYKFLESHGAPRRGSVRFWNKASVDEAEIGRRYTAGESENGLAEAFGVSRQVIKRALRDSGAARRDMTDANRLMVSKRTPEERSAFAQASHEAARGRKKTDEEKAQAALTRQRNGTFGSDYERAVARVLRRRDVKKITPQEAVGPYNCDLGAFPVAVEIFGGGWHWRGQHLVRGPKRVRYFADRGWSTLVIWVTRQNALTDAAGDYAAAYIEQARSDPPIFPEYRVIRGTGELVSSGRADLDDLAFIPTLTRRFD